MLTYMSTLVPHGHKPATLSVMRTMLCTLGVRIGGNGGADMNTENRSITLTIRDECDGPITEQCTIQLQFHQSLFDILCAKRPFGFWFALRSTSFTSFTYLNLTSFDNARHEVDTWGTSLFDFSQPSGYRLTLALDTPCPLI